MTTLKVLLIEDEPLLKDLISRIFNHMEIVFSIVSDKEEFEMELNKIDTYNIVLCDYNIPGITGVEMVKKIRAVSNVYVIAHSALSSRNGEMIDEGANDLLDKSPMEWKERLLECIDFAVKGGTVLK